MLAGPGEGLPEALARRFFQQLIFALDFCQRQGIANRSYFRYSSMCHAWHHASQGSLHVLYCWAPEHLAAHVCLQPFLGGQCFHMAQTELCEIAGTSSWRTHC